MADQSRVTHTEHVQGSRRRAAWWTAAPIAILCALAALVIDRPGYSPDEEITAVVATSIGSSGAPLLPSGIVYNRGAPYLYAAWLAGALYEPSMLAWRGVSLLSGVLGLVFAYRVGLAVAGPLCGVALTLLLAVFPPYIAASVFARQYSALIAASLGFVWSFTAWAGQRRHAWPSLVALGIAVLLHPIGIALAGLPLAFSALDEPGPRRRTVQYAIAALAVAAVVSALSYGTHAISLLLAGVSVSTDTAIYALPTPSLPQLFVVSLADARSWAAAAVGFALLGYAIDRFNPHNRPFLAVCLLCGLTFQLGVLLLIGTVAILLRPASTRRWLWAIVPVSLVSIVWWSIVVAAVTDAQLSIALSSSLAEAAMTYPLGRVRFAAAMFPVLATLALVGTMATWLRPESIGSRILRALIALSLALLAGLEIGSVPVTERYLLLPWLLMTIASSAGIAAMFSLASRLRTPRPLWRGALTGALAIALGALVLTDVYRYGRDREQLVTVPFAQQLFAPPTGPSWTPERLRSLAAPSDIVVCTEELACRYLLGKVDYLFALPPADTAHYVVTRSTAHVGFYAGATAISSKEELEGLVRKVGPERCVLVVGLRSGKVGFEEYKTIVAAAPAEFDVGTIMSNEDASVSRMCVARR